MSDSIVRAIFVVVSIARGRLKGSQVAVAELRGPTADLCAGRNAYNAMRAAGRASMPKLRLAPANGY